MMRLLLAFVFPLLALCQTKADPTQVQAATASAPLGRYAVLCSIPSSPKPTVGWCWIDSSFSLAQGTDGKWTITARTIPPALQVDSFIANSPTQTFQASKTPFWFPLVMRNGLYQRQEADYTLASGVYTFLLPLTVGDYITLVYPYL